MEFLTEAELKRLEGACDNDSEVALDPHELLALIAEVRKEPPAPGRQTAHTCEHPCLYEIGQAVRTRLGCDKLRLYQHEACSCSGFGP